MVEEVRQFLKKILGKNYDSYETQIQKWRKEVIVRNPKDFAMLSKGAHIKEFEQTYQGNLYFEHSFSSSHIDRWQFELVGEKEEFLKNYKNRYRYQKK